MLYIFQFEGNPDELELVSAANLEQAKGVAGAVGENDGVWAVDVVELAKIIGHDGAKLTLTPHKE